MPGQLTGRIKADPDELLDRLVLTPQFEFELDAYLGHYLAIEMVFLAEYERMGLVDARQGNSVRDALHVLARDGVSAEPAENMSDIVLAIEKAVHRAVSDPLPGWHVDRSRNDMQACAQLMFGRSALLDVLDSLILVIRSAHALALRHVEEPMPAYSHLQRAQVISPGFYFSALAEELETSATRTLTTWDRMNLCPLGAGAMSGQEIPWDRGAMAEALGFDAPQEHALVAVASRAWMAWVSSDVALLATTISRFTTDLMAWGGDMGFLVLPDRLAGISSAMPQKKNYPVLERVRGRCSHLVAGHVDVLLCQHNTAFGNSVEVSKEGGSAMVDSLATAVQVCELLTAVLQHSELDLARMRQSSSGDFLGGMTLANTIAQADGVPWREAQVLVGEYVSALREMSQPLDQPDAELLHRLARDRGHTLHDPGAALASAVDVDQSLRSKTSAGGTGPTQVSALIARQQQRIDHLAVEVKRRRTQIETADTRGGRR